MKARLPRTTKVKRRKGPTAARRRGSSAADLQQQLDQRTRELAEALEQQTATSEVLKVISSSPGKLEPVFQSLLANATRICGAKFGTMHRFDGELFHPAAHVGTPPALVEYQKKRGPFRPNAGGGALDRVMRTKKAVYSADDAAERAPGTAAKLGGARSLVAVPMLKDDALVGAIVIYRQEVRPFTDKQIELLMNFAAQAVIAIENTRLLSELRQRTEDLSESLQQQTATSEVLQVISSSPGELLPVFEILLENATRVCQAKFGNLALCEGDGFRNVAIRNATPAVDNMFRGQLLRPHLDSPILIAARTKQAAHFSDLRATIPYREGNPAIVALADRGGARTIICVPMLKESALVGVINLYRDEVRPFTDKQIELVQNFAAQAVIAIENTRLLNELRQRTDDLSEALEQQTATSEVLRVISSSPGELEPVFQSMLENATRICEAKFGVLYLHEDGNFRPAAMVSPTPEFDAFVKERGAFTPTPDQPLSRLLKTKAVVGETSEGLNEGRSIAAFRFGGARTHIAVPMLKEREVVGAIMIFRQEARPFTHKQIELVQNFAAQAVIAIENTRLLNELRELLQQQTATSEVLGVISSSPGELGPVFQAMLENAVQICEAKFGVLFRYEGDVFHHAASLGVPPVYADFIRQRGAFRPEPGAPLYTLMQTREIVHRADEFNEPNPGPAGKYGGARSVIAVPMIKDNELIGAIVIYRQEVRPFTDKQIELVQNFAAQAVIAVENARLLNELRQRTDDLSESLEQQTATSDVLRVISSSPGELEPVFKAMLDNATRICEAKFGSMYLHEGDAFRFVAHHNAPPAWVDLRRREPVIRPGPGTGLGQVALTKRVYHIADVRRERGYIDGDPVSVTGADIAGYRSLLAVPMIKDNQLVGTIVIYRLEVRPFTDKQIELVSNFAAQAVIAIENTRLLNELRESLQQQTATAEVLQVISSSPGDLEPVFNAMLENAVRICDAKFGTLYLYDGERFHVASLYNAPPAYAENRKGGAIRPHPGTGLGRVAQTKQVVHITDITTEQAYTEGDPLFVSAVKLAGYRTLLSVPMLKEKKLIGSIAIFRQEVRPFSDKQIALVTNFASQAVVAIENVRLLNELQQSLQQQTATADVLKVISRSTFDLQTVLDTLVQSAAKVCEADTGIIRRREDETFPVAATFGFTAEQRNHFARYSPQPDRGSAFGRAILEARTIHIPDLLVDRELDQDRLRDYAGAINIRTGLGVPLIREGTVVGVFTLQRREQRPFTDKQIELVETFADQAVIAIENTRLLNELRESLQQQTATADVLKVISRSTFDLKAVLDTLVESATQLCEADIGNIALPKEGGILQIEANYGQSPTLFEELTRSVLRPGKGSVIGRAALTREIVHILDAQTDPDYTLHEARRIGRYHTMLGVPLLREGTLIGVFGLARRTVRAFTEKQVELATTFADQAAIAIENVRLFDAEQQRTRELAQSLGDLRTAQDRLVQTEKLASLGQLTAGIAHEIKNPLNFVNNFSAVSVELIDELREALSSAHLDSKLRAEISEIADMLQGNLDKVVQHGKRADSIVKNMLLHSRQGSGEHRPVDINALVEESLNLAYHGARAEKQGFNITLESSFDPAAGEVDVFPQEITRVLLNLISNGFYATAKRKADANGGSYEPILAATTRSLGDRVEIRIRDNGIGIPPEVKEKMFNPFFTTKPAGEGTGLGLSISHDIIVKQHGGSIEVDTQPGEFTEFRIVLPRGAATMAK